MIIHDMPDLVLMIPTIYTMGLREARYLVSQNVELRILITQQWRYIATLRDNIGAQGLLVVLGNEYLEYS